MRLFEHPDFATIMMATGEHFGMRPQLAEKDYYVTEALRAVATRYGSKVVFRGGTSLSKGWRVIPRFSEDVDLFVDPDRFEPRLDGKNRVNKELKRLRDAIARHPALTLLTDAGHTTGGLAREDHFAFETRFEAIAGMRSAVMVEPGIRSGSFPTEVVSLRSLAAEYLDAVGLARLSDDLEPFDMTLLHYRRTYVEKLFTLHSKVTAMMGGGTPIGRDARHYADVELLGRTEEVQAMLRSPEYSSVKVDCDAISRKYFANYNPPPNLQLSASPALFPDDGLAAALRKAYGQQCELLFYGPYPPFEQVSAGLEAVRDLL